MRKKNGFSTTEIIVILLVLIIFVSFALSRPSTGAEFESYFGDFGKHPSTLFDGERDLVQPVINERLRVITEEYNAVLDSLSSGLWRDSSLDSLRSEDVKLSLELKKAMGARCRLAFERLIRAKRSAEHFKFTIPENLPEFRCQSKLKAGI